MGLVRLIQHILQELFVDCLLDRTVNTWEQLHGFTNYTHTHTKIFNYSHPPTYLLWSLHGAIIY